MKVPEFFYPEAVSGLLIQKDGQYPLLPRGLYSFNRGLSGNYRANRTTFLDPHPHHLHVSDRLDINATGLTSSVSVEYLDAEMLTISGRRTQYDLPINVGKLKARTLILTDAILEADSLEATSLIVNTASRLIVKNALQVGDVLFVHDSNRGGLRTHRHNRHKNAPLQINAGCMFEIGNARVTSHAKGERYSHHPMVSFGDRVGLSGEYGDGEGPYQSPSAFIYHCSGVMDGCSLTCLLTDGGAFFSGGGWRSERNWSQVEIVERLRKDLIHLLSSTTLKPVSWMARVGEYRAALSFVQNMLLISLPYVGKAPSIRRGILTDLETCRVTLALAETAMISNVKGRA